MVRPPVTGSTGTVCMYIIVRAQTAAYDSSSRGRRSAYSPASPRDLYMRRASRVLWEPRMPGPTRSEND
ncbi:hypothetical protein VTH06DRAFT_4793 [Thermothelomyces fergusii]